jgi:hypothetical protein
MEAHDESHESQTFKFSNLTAHSPRIDRCDLSAFVNDDALVGRGWCGAGVSRDAG